jgi:hypothetical protein
VGQRRAAGRYDEVYVANMGPHSLDMIAFYGSDVIPALTKS